MQIFQIFFKKIPLTLTTNKQSFSLIGSVLDELFKKQNHPLLSKHPVHTATPPPLAEPVQYPACS